MTIEESIQKDPEKFQALLDATTPEVQQALDEMSAKFDVIFGNAIKRYCEAEQVEAQLADYPTYKAMNRMITGKIDEIVKEHVKGKRADIL